MEGDIKLSPWLYLSRYYLPPFYTEEATEAPNGFTTLLVSDQTSFKPRSAESKARTLPTTWIHIQEVKAKHSSEVSSGAEQRVLKPVPPATSLLGGAGIGQMGGHQCHHSPETPQYCGVLWRGSTWGLPILNLYQNHRISSTPVFFQLFDCLSPCHPARTHTQLQQYFYWLSAKHCEIFSFLKKKKTVLVKTLSLKTLHYTPEEAILISPRSGGHVKNGEGPSEFLILVCFPELVPFQLSIPSHFPHPRSSRILWPRPGSVLPVILALRASPFWGKALFYLPSVAINPNSNIP